MPLLGMIVAAALSIAEPLPFVPGSETLVLLPDTQYYSQRYPQHFLNQTQWVRQNVRERRIRMVLQLGDVTNDNCPSEWTTARKCMEPLRGVVPFALAMGNHDYGVWGSCNRRRTMANQYFPLREYRDQMNVEAEFEPGRIENLAHTVRIANQDWLVLNLEFGPRDSVLQWADEVVREHPRHKVIMITHAYLFSDGSRYDNQNRHQPWDPHCYGIEREAEKPNDGQEMWDKLVRRHRNFRFVFSGHVLNDGLGRLTSFGDQGNPVQQHAVNFQMNREGGEGYLRLVEFLPDGRTVQCRTYSPSLNRYKTDSENQFVMDMATGAVRVPR